MSAPSSALGRIPPEAASALRPELPSLADEIVAAVRSEVPAYASGELPPRLPVGVEEALRQFVDTIGGPGDTGGGRDLYASFGRGEMRAGRGLDGLLAAYRVGARVAWRRLSAAGASAGLEPETLYLLAESIFAYIDELSAYSAEGYAEEQSATAAERERRRRRVVALLAQSPAADPAVVEAAAEEAGWRLPRELAVIAVDGFDPGRLAGAVAPEVLAASVDGVGCVVVPDPDGPGRGATLERALGARPATGAAIGPVVAWPEAHVSFERAVDALELVRAGALHADGPVRAADHTLSLVLRRERRLLRDLRSDALAPLAGLTPAARERLTTTLLAWLRHRGRVEPTAAELHVHPQTVRYRLGRLREALGEALDDPERRLELELSLRSERLERAVATRGERTAAGAAA